VGFRKLYQQAHIPGSEFFGPGSDSQVLAKLRARLAGLPRTTEIIIYCGCCPLEHCPNLKPTNAVVQELGLPNAKVLYIPKDLGADWVAHGYPVSKGD
jgi:thiosulfate/3-mercaptopyruvate sulfurtransferase